ncbi:LuxR family maltose regulon positive regulatory protein [Clostridium tetanomorphum]|uniref:LuxR C-terminal-related transcriptional regulator n=1 Tax=Clostridium tetanomorphum TaxID=1553 RepID=UPI00044EA8F1|nr:LuxR C-terminal-related transcriptional regulator [Clostridium tetanomorphum]KAJ51664.1 LuxR family transcriptional regulator [Clostridium tetanomorphum DSM 665]KAJ51944.1 LuxR family transcriptional regulator [Clostridium tetanomorphum DSM 665]MBP1864047.1 LuxR family maltose regulon positive regulatory protein [Clostridium tetanomorphum]NRS84459.1 LuxR family maltose regulon positive regulatory protein [Clostridium tetanomorphum]SQB92044.1 LuxR family transcriptional regulator [Clostridiu
MSNRFNLIATKLISPVPRKNYVKREKLVKELEHILDYKVIIIKGTAGSGKSTLFSSFVKEKKLSNVKWINLDGENNELFSFWYYLIESLKEYLQDEGQQLINTFSTFMKKDDIFNIIPYIVNELSDGEDIFLVFDDYHYIKDKFLNSTLEYLIKYSSSNVHYVFLTREDVPIYLGELRIKGHLLEIGEDNLKFSEKECLNFIKDTLNIILTEDVVDKIFNISEGWIAGIQLIALALKNRKDNIFNDITVLNKYVIEYLTEEILNQLSSDEKNFLIKTSILEYFNIELSNNILNITNSKEIIDSLLNKNLFIIVLDEQNNIYRYHHLFKEFLNISFSKLNEDEKKELHIMAYKSFKEIGDYKEGIKHLLKIKYYDKALVEIEQNAQNFNGLCYLKEIPLEYLFTSQQMTLQRIFYHFCNLQMDEYKRILNLLGKKIDEPQWQIIKMFKVVIDDYNGSFEEIDLNCIENFNFSDITKAIIYLNICILLLSQDEFEKVIYYADKCDNIGQKNEFISISFFGKGQKAMALEELGQLYEAENTLDEMKDMIKKSRIFSNLIFMYHLGIAGIYMKRCELEKSEEQLVLAQKFSNINKGFADRSILYNIMEIKFLKGEVEEGIKLANKLVEEYSTDAFNLLLSSVRLEYFISSSVYSINDLQTYKEIYENTKENTRIYIQISDRIVYSTVLYLLGEKDEAFNILNKCLEYCRKNKIITYLVTGLINMALMLKEDFDKRKREIYNLIREAIHYSIDNKYIKPYVLKGEDILTIIKKLNDDKHIELTVKEKNFIKNLMNIMHSKNIKHELLTEREKEVLKVLSEGTSNKEIGEKLNISLATVKTHIINIYSKLGVSNRVQAVEQGKKFKII